MVVVIVGILASAALIAGDDGPDPLIARQARLFVSIVAGAYFISRGLAKSGSRELYWDNAHAERGNGHDRR